MRMTIKDIARLSGYGIGTVSRVLNNHPDVSEKARKKILSVIEENNFQPNSNARHLKMQSSSSVILIVKGTSNLLFADIVEQMQSLFLKNGENVSTYYIDEDANEVNYAIQLCRDRNPKGIVFLGGNFVTSCPVWVTPSATTPLSAAMTITAFFLKCGFLSR